MSDSLTDAQKIIRDVISSHRYDISDYHVHRCICGDDIGLDAIDAHRSVAVDEALGGLRWETVNRATYPHEYFPESRFVGGWTPEGRPMSAHREYLEAVLAFHEPNTPPSTCMWCGLPSPCPPYLNAQEALDTNPCPGCICPDHDAPRHCPEHGPPAEHPMNVCAHGEED